MIFRANIMFIVLPTNHRTCTPHCPDNLCNQRHWRHATTSGTECSESPCACPPIAPTDTRVRIAKIRRMLHLPSSPANTDYWICALQTERSSVDRGIALGWPAAIDGHHGMWCPSAKGPCWLEQLERMRRDRLFWRFLADPLVDRWLISTSWNNSVNM